MLIILIIAGVVLGLMFSGDREALGMGLGAGFGYLLHRVRVLGAEVRALDKQVRDASPASAPEAPLVMRPVPMPEAAPASVTDSTESVEEPLRGDVVRPSSMPEPATFAEEPRMARKEPADVGPSPASRLFGYAKNWLLSGNVPVKVGVIITFFGVSFLLKYAADQNMFSFPIEFRLILVAAGAVILLIFGWRLREKSTVYALSLQGGAIGILYLTIFAGMRLYDLIPAQLAFGLLIVLTIAGGILAVIQDAKSLAILASVGGFLAPVLVSTGQGSHVGLFSYYLLINAAILAIAWFKSWRELNLVGFAFTFLIAGIWGYRYYRPEFFASTEPFLIAFFLLYQAIAIMFSYRQTPQLRGVVDGTLIFGTPIIAFAMQARLLKGSEYGLAISAVVVALFFIACAALIQRRRDSSLRMLVESYLALAIAFATLAIPLALDARWTAASWALEGALLVWVGVRQNNWLARVSGAALIFFAGGSFLSDWSYSRDAMFLLNGDFVGGALISVGALFAAWQLDKVDSAPNVWRRVIAFCLLIWGLLWWFGAGWMEIAARSPDPHQLLIATWHAAVSGVLWAFAAQRLDWRRARLTGFSYVLLIAIFGFIYLIDKQHLLVGWAILAWLGIWVAQFAILKVIPRETRLLNLWHGLSLLGLALIGVIEWHYWADVHNLTTAWSHAVASAILGLFAAAVLRLDRVFHWPIGVHWYGWIGGASVLACVQLLYTLAMSMNDNGNPAPLPYIPLLNPYDLAATYALLVAARVGLRVNATTDWLMSAKKPVGGLLLAAAFVLTTFMVVRGVHQWLDIPWRGGFRFGSVAVQAALSVYWSILGVSAMMIGARTARRPIWIAGASLMILVAVKLLLVDLGNTATIARIVSFLAVGPLLLLVGYFAPVPPKQPDSAAPISSNKNSEPEGDAA